MSKYLILGHPFRGRFNNSKTYRGVGRNYLPTANDGPKRDRLNQAIDFFYDTVVNPSSIVIEDVGKARRICDEYNQFNTDNERFEVVEVFSEDEFVKGQKANFIGWDIMGLSENSSFIAEFLDPGFTSSVNGQNKTTNDVNDLKDLVKKYFSRCLNENVLFNELSEVKECIGCVQELDKYNAQYFEGWPVNDFKPIALFLVS